MTRKKENSCPRPMFESLYGKTYSLDRADLPAAAKLMASAFSRDPSIRYLLGGIEAGSRDWEYFLCVLRALYGKCLILSLDEGINSLLILCPPELKAVPTVSFLVGGGAALFRSFGPDLFFRSLNYEGNCRAVKSRFAAAHTWYCLCLAVSPQLQGRGLGSRLIRPALETLEASRCSLYLETHRELNVSIYRHLGFELLDSSPIPGTNITQYAMMKG